MMAACTCIPPWGILEDMHEASRQKAIRRLKIVEGQLRGLVGMVSEGKYCVDIITQSSAIKEALSGIEQLILENHLSTHVIQQMKSGKERRAIDEILKLYRLAQKKK